MRHMHQDLSIQCAPADRCRGESRRDGVSCKEIKDKPCHVQGMRLLRSLLPCGSDQSQGLHLQSDKSSDKCLWQYSGGAIMTFEPNILSFCCNWCSYAGADLAGVSRFQYPPNIRIIRVMCSGRIEPVFVLKAFKDGADGVLVAGCHLPSDCPYLSGNFKAQRRVFLMKEALKQFGIEPERLRVEWVSASEGDRFATVMKEMVEEIRKLGPS